MTTPNDHIPRSAVLEAIEAVDKNLFSPTHPALATVKEIRARVEALPAAPVDSTPAPQPALDVDALVARATEAARNAVNHELLRDLTAQLKQERERAERNQRMADNATRAFNKACAERDTLAARLAEVERERDAWKNRSNNHAESLRSIAKMKDDEADRMRLWATDSLSGYTQTVDETMVELRDRAAAAEKALADARRIISECADAIGNGSFCLPTASLEFMAEIPREIDLVVKALKAALAGLGEVESVVIYKDGYLEDPCAIRRVLDAGGA